MDLLQNIMQILGSNAQSGGLLSQIGQILGTAPIQNEQVPQSAQSYYQLPTYNYQTPPSIERLPNKVTNQASNMQNFIKIVAIVLQYLMTKKQAPQSDAPTPIVSTQTNTSKIDLLKRTDNKI